MPIVIIFANLVNIEKILIIDKDLIKTLQKQQTMKYECSPIEHLAPLSRRITMGVRGIRALEEWCRRSTQVVRGVR